MDSASGGWRKLATLFHHDVSEIARTYPADAPDYDELCFGTVVTNWLYHRGTPEYPVSWNGFMKALKDIELDDIAEDTEKALNCVTIAKK